MGAASERFGKNVERLEPGLVLKLKSYAWPGNVRELKSVVDRLVLFHDGPVLREGWWDPPQVPASVEPVVEAAARPSPQAPAAALPGGMPSRSDRIAYARQLIQENGLSCPKWRLVRESIPRRCSDGENPEALTRSLKRWRPSLAAPWRGGRAAGRKHHSGTCPSWGGDSPGNPIFWRNAGGYSVELRDVIRLGFPFLLVADVVLVAFLVAGLFRSGALHPRQARGALVLAAIQILLLGATTERVVHNNIANLWNGRPSIGSRPCLRDPAQFPIGIEVPVL